MLRIRVCAAHMDGILGPNLSKQGSLFRHISLTMAGFSRNWQKIVKKLVVFRQNSS